MTTIQQLAEKLSQLSDQQLAEVLKANEAIEANIKGFADEALVLAPSEALRRWGSMFPPKTIASAGREETLYEAKETPAATPQKNSV